jgi:hypothetical protein
MAAPSTMKVTELEFDQIKANLKAFLSAKPEFKDYDFEASGLSFLLDTLAYNTHYNALMANFVANEMFLDTAAKRSSVLSHAKALGYRTRGIRSSRAKVDITINNLTLVNGATAPDTFVLPKGTPFISTVGNTQFQFVTLNDLSAPKNPDDSYTLNDVELVEGVLFSYEYYVTDESPGVIYPIPNQSVDTSTTALTVRQSVSDVTPTQWQRSDTILNIDENSKVYWTQEGMNGYYEFFFGNGQMGVIPPIGSILVIEYVSSQGFASNGAKKFVPVARLAHEGNGNITAASYRITLVQESVGGADPETIPEIKHNAANHFIVQDRAVTVSDYKALIQEYFANVRSIKVWGGESNNPVRYGKVMVCIQPQYGDYITQTEKDYISSIIKEKSVISVGLEYVDPEYLNINVSTIAYYDPTKKPKSMNLATSIKNVVQTYSEYELEKFAAHFRFSKFSTEIDSTDASVNSNTTTITIYKTLIPKLNQTQSYTVNFYNKIKTGSNTVNSTLFKIYGESNWVRLSNIGSNLYAVYTNSIGKVIQVAFAGTVDLTRGVVNLSSLEFTEVYGSEFRISVNPTYLDISSGLNNILRIRPDDISVKTVAELPTEDRNLV